MISIFVTSINTARKKKSKESWFYIFEPFFYSKEQIFMRFILLLLLLIILNSCNLENGINKNYIISQMKEKEKVDQNAK